MWKLLKSTKLHSDKWIDVRANKYSTNKGDIIEPYYILHYPDWVNVFAITKNREVIVNKQYRPGLNKICLELPSGWVDKDELPKETARRELLEETGYFVDEAFHTGSVSANPSTHTNLNHCFIAFNASFTEFKQLEVEEDIEVELIPIHTVFELAKKGNFIQSLHVSAIFFALNYLNEHHEELLK